MAPTLLASSLAPRVRDFRNLKVWQKSHELTLVVYRLSSRFPREEFYGLTSQLRRACASISANVTEGCGRSGDAELARFCSIALGSASELEYHLTLAKDLGLLHSDEHADLTTRTIEVKRMLAGLLRRLKAES